MEGPEVVNPNAGSHAINCWSVRDLNIFSSSLSPSPHHSTPFKNIKNAKLTWKKKTKGMTAIYHKIRTEKMKGISVLYHKSKQTKQKNQSVTCLQSGRREEPERRFSS